MSQLSIKELPKRRKMQVDQEHPTYKIQKRRFLQDEDDNLEDISMLYGSAFAMMIKHERQVLAQPERMPGLRSSFLSLQSVMGRLGKLQFEDTFNRNPIIKGPTPHDLYLRQFS